MDDRERWRQKGRRKKHKRQRSSVAFYVKRHMYRKKAQAAGQKAGRQQGKAGQRREGEATLGTGKAQRGQDKKGLGKLLKMGQEGRVKTAGVMPLSRAKNAGMLKYREIQ